MSVFWWRMPFPPLDPVSVTVSGVTTCIRLFEITYQLKSVGTQTAALLKTVQHVQRNINEAQRLRQLKIHLLKKAEIEWMDKIIDDTHKALVELAKLMEKVRIDQETKKSIGFGHRAMWVLRDNPDVVNKHREMSICHDSLNTVISVLHSKDVVVVTPAPPPSIHNYYNNQPPPAYDPAMAELFERRQTLKHRKTTSCLHSKSLATPKPSDLGQLRSISDPPPKSPFSAPRSSSVRTRIEPTETMTSSSSKAEIGLEATKEDLRASKGDQHPTTRPTHRITTLVDPTNEYLDDISALHRLSFGDDIIPDSAIPPRPPKMPLQPHPSTLSTPLDTVPIHNTSQEQDYIPSPSYSGSYSWSRPRRTETSWLAYHATRSDLSQLGGSSTVQIAACLHLDCSLAVSPKAAHSMAAFAVHQNHG